MLKIQQIDAYYCGFPKASAIYLIRDTSTGESALIDSGTPGSYKRILDSIQKLGVQKRDLTKIIITHQHLDHSANACLFVKDFPHIQIYAHPLALRVLESPWKWKTRMEKSMHWKSFKREFWDLTSTPPQFLNPIVEGSRIMLGKSALNIVECPGHSSSCVSILGQSDQGLNLFAGDAFGTRYPDISPRSMSSCPPHYKHKETMESYRKLIKLNPNLIWISHFGCIKDPLNHAKDCMNFEEQMYQAVIEKNENLVHQKIIQAYENVFGKGCMKKHHKLFSHSWVNERGVRTLRALMSGNIPFFDIYIK